MFDLKKRHTGETWEQCSNMWNAFCEKEDEELFSVSAGKVMDNELELWQRILFSGTNFWC